MLMTLILTLTFHRHHHRRQQFREADKISRKFISQRSQKSCKIGFCDFSFEVKFMNSNSCGKGLVIFSITLVLGIGIASLFISEMEISDLSQTQITKKEVLVKPKDKKVCIKEYEKLDRYIEEDKNLYAPLVQKKAELEAELLKNKSEQIEREIEKTDKDIEELNYTQLIEKIKNLEVKLVEEMRESGILKEPYRTEKDKKIKKMVSELSDLQGKLEDMKKLEKFNKDFELSFPQNQNQNLLYTENCYDNEF